MAVLELELPDVQELDVEKMRELRKARKMTQTEAAKAAGMMSASRWSDIEAGERTNVTVETLSAIAAALGVDARDLLTPKPKRGK